MKKLLPIIVVLLACVISGCGGETAGSPSSLRLTAVPSRLEADGIATSKIDIRDYGPGHALEKEDKVTLQFESEDSECGAFKDQEGAREIDVEIEDGKPKEEIYVLSSKACTAVVSGQSEKTKQTDDVNVIFTEPERPCPSRIEILAVPMTINAGGEDTATIHSTAWDCDSQGGTRKLVKGGGKKISFATTEGMLLDQNNEETTVVEVEPDENGLAEVRLRSGYTDGTATVTATFKDMKRNERSASVEVNFLDTSRVVLTVETDRAEMYVDEEGSGTERATITVTATREKEEVVSPVWAGVPVEFSIDPCNEETRVAGIWMGGGCNTTKATNAEGVAKAFFMPGPEPRIVTISALIGNAIGSVKMNLVKLPTEPTLNFVAVDPSRIHVKGTIGMTESTVTFQVNYITGDPYPNQEVHFELSTYMGGISLSQDKAVTDETGIVRTILKAGTVATPVNVKASLSYTVEDTGEIKTVQAFSTPISIVAGPPSAGHFSFVCPCWNFMALTTDGQMGWAGYQMTCSVHLADRYDNVVEAGTQVLFRSEAGAFESAEGGSPGAATTGDNGIALITHKSMDPPPQDVLPEPWEEYCVGGHPRDGWSALLAFVPGEEDFVDVNGDGLFNDGEDCGLDNLCAEDEGYPGSDAGEGDGVITGDERWVDRNNDGEFTKNFSDMGEPYVDANDNNQWDIGEEFIDSNNNRKYDGPNGKWDANTNVWKDGIFIWSTPPSWINSTLTPEFFSIPNGGFLVFDASIKDYNCNPVPLSQVSAGTEGGTLRVDGTAVINYSSYHYPPPAFSWVVSDTNAGLGSQSEPVSFKLSYTFSEICGGAGGTFDDEVVRWGTLEGEADNSSITLAVNDKALLADGASSTGVVATAYDWKGRAVADGTEIVFTTTAGTLSDGPIGGTTLKKRTLDGVAGIQLTSTPFPETASVSAFFEDLKAGKKEIMDPVTVEFVQPIGVQLYLGKEGCLVNNGDTMTIEAVVDVGKEGGCPAGLPLTFSVFPDQPPLIASLSDGSQSGLTELAVETPGGDKNAKAYLVAEQGKVGVVTVVAMVGALGDAKQVCVLPSKDKSQVVLEASPLAIFADGVSKAEVTARAYEVIGDPVAEGTEIMLGTTAGEFEIEGEAKGQMVTIEADAAGKVSASLVSGLSESLANLTAVFENMIGAGIEGSATVDFIRVGEIAIEAGSGQVACDETVQLVTAKVTRRNGTPFPDGQIVTFKMDNPDVGTLSNGMEEGDTVEAEVSGGGGGAQAAFISAECGHYGTTVVTVEAGSATTLVRNSVGLRVTPQAELSSIVMNAVPVAIEAGGTETSAISVVAVDSDGNPAAQKNLVLATTSGGFDETLGAKTYRVKSDQNGMVTATLRSAATDGKANVSASFTNLFGFSTYGETEVNFVSTDDITLATTYTEITNDGAWTLIKARLGASAGEVPDGKKVEFSFSTQPADLGDFVNASGQPLNPPYMRETSGGMGEAGIRFKATTDSTKTGVAFITARSGGVANTIVVKVVNPSLNLSSSASDLANTAQSANILVRAFSMAGPLDGKEVKFAFLDENGAVYEDPETHEPLQQIALGSLSAMSVITAGGTGEGVVKFTTVKDTTKIGIVRIRAGLGSVTKTVSIRVLPAVSSSEILVLMTPGVLEINGEKAAITAYLFDADGKEITENRAVSLLTNAGKFVKIDKDTGNETADLGRNIMVNIKDAAGTDPNPDIDEIKLKSGSVATSATVTASFTDSVGNPLSTTATVRFVESVSVTLASDAYDVVDDESTALLTATVATTSALAPDGKGVTFELTTAPAGLGQFIDAMGNVVASPIMVRTAGGKGEAWIRFRSVNDQTKKGTSTITARSGGVSGRVVLNVVNPTVALTVGDKELFSNGSFTNVTAMVYSSSGPIDGKDVTFSFVDELGNVVNDPITGQPAQSISVGSLSSLSEKTAGGTGMATVKFTATTQRSNVGVARIKATSWGASATTQIKVVPDVDNSQIVVIADPPVLEIGGETAELSAMLYDANGSLIDKDKSIRLITSEGTFYNAVTGKDIGRDIDVNVNDTLGTDPNPDIADVQLMSKLLPGKAVIIASFTNSLGNKVETSKEVTFVETTAVTLEVDKLVIYNTGENNKAIFSAGIAANGEAVADGKEIAFYVVDAAGNPKSVNDDDLLGFFKDANGTHVTFIPVRTEKGKASLTFYANENLLTGEGLVMAKSGTKFDVNSVVIDTTQLTSIEFVSASPTRVGVRGTTANSLSVVTFKLLDGSGNPFGSGVPVKFVLDQGVGGVEFANPKRNPDNPNDPIVSAADYSVSNINSMVMTTVRSGTVATTIVVKVETLPPITAENDPLRPSPQLSALSGPIVVTGGPPSAGHMKLHCDDDVMFNMVGNANDCTVFLADRFDNVVPTGTQVVFRSEAGAFQGGSGGQPGSAETDSNGEAGIRFKVMPPEPKEVERLAVNNDIFYGDVPFPDSNANNIFDGVDFQGSTVDSKFIDLYSYDENTSSWAATYPAYPGRIGASSGYFFNYGEPAVPGAGDVMMYPRKNFNSIIAFTNGEEEFYDVNGDGYFNDGEDCGRDLLCKGNTPEADVNLATCVAGRGVGNFVDDDGDGVIDDCGYPGPDADKSEGDGTLYLSERYVDANGDGTIMARDLDCGTDRICPTNVGYTGPDADGSENDGTIYEKWNDADHDGKFNVYTELDCGCDGICGYTAGPDGIPGTADDEKTEGDRFLSRCEKYIDSNRNGKFDMTGEDCGRDGICVGDLDYVSADADGSEGDGQVAFGNCGWWTKTPIVCQPGYTNPAGYLIVTRSAVERFWAKDNNPADGDYDYELNGLGVFHFDPRITWCNPCAVGVAGETCPNDCDCGVDGICPGDTDYVGPDGDGSEGSGVLSGETFQSNTAHLTGQNSVEFVTTCNVTAPIVTGGRNAGNLADQRTVNFVSITSITLGASRTNIIYDGNGTIFTADVKKTGGVAVDDGLAVTFTKTGGGLTGSFYTMDGKACADPCVVEVKGGNGQSQTRWLADDGTADSATFKASAGGVDSADLTIERKAPWISVVPEVDTADDSEILDVKALVRCSSGTGPGFNKTVTFTSVNGEVDCGGGWDTTPPSTCSLDAEPGQDGWTDVVLLRKKSGGSEQADIKAEVTGGAGDICLGDNTFSDARNVYFVSTTTVGISASPLVVVPDGYGTIITAEVNKSGGSGKAQDGKWVTFSYQGLSGNVSGSFEYVDLDTVCDDPAPGSDCSVVTQGGRGRAAVRFVPAASTYGSFRVKAWTANPSESWTSAIRVARTDVTVVPDRRTAPVSTTVNLTAKVVRELSPIGSKQVEFTSSSGTLGNCDSDPPCKKATNAQGVASPVTIASASAGAITIRADFEEDLPANTRSLIADGMGALITANVLKEAAAACIMAMNDGKKINYTIPTTVPAGLTGTFLPSGSVETKGRQGGVSARFTPSSSSYGTYIVRIASDGAPHDGDCTDANDTCRDVTVEVVDTGVTLVGKDDVKAIESGGVETGTIIAYAMEGGTPVTTGTLIDVALAPEGGDFWVDCDGPGGLPPDNTGCTGVTSGPSLDVLVTSDSPGAATISATFETSSYDTHTAAMQVNFVDTQGVSISYDKAQVLTDTEDYILLDAVVTAGGAGAPDGKTVSFNASPALAGYFSPATTFTAGGGGHATARFYPASSFTGLVTFTATSGGVTSDSITASVINSGTSVVPAYRTVEHGSTVAVSGKAWQNNKPPAFNTSVLATITPRDATIAVFNSYGPGCDGTTNGTQKTAKTNQVGQVSADIKGCGIGTAVISLEFDAMISGDNYFSPNFVDLSEPYVDANDNKLFDPGEEFIDANGNGIWDGPNNKWDATTTIWKPSLIVYGGVISANTIFLIPATDFVIPNRGSENFALFIADDNLNPAFDATGKPPTISIKAEEEVIICDAQGNCTITYPAMPVKIAGTVKVGYNYIYNVVVSDRSPVDTDPPNTATLTVDLGEAGSLIIAGSTD